MEEEKKKSEDVVEKDDKSEVLDVNKEINKEIEEFKEKNDPKDKDEKKKEANIEAELEQVDKDGLELHPWIIPTLVLTPATALEVLLTLPIRRLHGLLFSSTLKYAIECAKFAIALIVKQHFIPHLRKRKTKDNTINYYAVWKPFITDEETEYRQR